jgi:hypothetical protein
MRREVNFCDLVAKRDGKTLYVGRTKAIGLGVDRL